MKKKKKKYRDDEMIMKQNTTTTCALGKCKNLRVFAAPAIIFYMYVQTVQPKQCRPNSNLLTGYSTIGGSAEKPVGYYQLRSFQS